MFNWETFLIGSYGISLACSALGFVLLLNFRFLVSYWNTGHLAMEYLRICAGFEGAVLDIIVDYALLAERCIFFKSIACGYPNTFI